MSNRSTPSITSSACRENEREAEPAIEPATILSASAIKAAARQLGFAACGIAPAEPMAEPYASRLKQWIAEGQHGEMDYLERQLEMRLDPRLVVEGAQTVVSLALNYYPRTTLSPEGFDFARYAYGKDYHDVVRQRLRLLMAELGLEEHTDGRPFCDTAPIDERYWARRCGLGWTGKNTQLIIPRAGSYFFLGELLLKHPCDHYDTPMEESFCGTCRRCLDACPTQALDGEHLDARRCLSYLTIEHRGALPEAIKAKLGRCVYGCDRCAEACPWNKFARATDVDEFCPSEALQAMTADDWRRLTVEQYRQLFKGSAVKRAKFEGLQRNINAIEASD